MTVKVGLIGCGDIAACHIDGYLAVPDEAHVTAVSDIAEATARAAARRLGDPQVFGDFHSLITQADVDAVDICLPHHLHRDAIFAAAAAGKHILCEKPLCLNHQQADDIRRAIKESGVTLMCAHNQLFDPAIQRAKAMLAEGLLGRIYAIRTVDAFRLTKTEMASMTSWRGKKETMGGGELIDTGYHPTYMMLYLADSEPAQVTAMLSKHRIEVIDGEDSAQVLVRFANGTIGNIVSSWAFDLRSGTPGFHVIGERGQLYGQDNHLFYKVDDFAPAELVLPPLDTFQAEVADFIACLREHRRPLQTETEGIRVLNVILAAYRSAEEQRVVDVLADNG